MIRGYPSKLQILSSSRIPQRHFLTKQRTCGVELKSMRSWHKEWYHRFMLIKAIFVLIIIQTLDLSIGLLRNLKWLNLESSRLEYLPKELPSLTSIKELRISGSGPKVKKHQLHVLFDGLRSLQILHLKDCNNLFELPDNISVLSKLQELILNGGNVKRLPESIRNLQGLEILSLEECREIRDSLNLDGRSLKHIMESLNLTMMSATFQNVSVRRLRVDVHSYNYTSVDACLPGTRVPQALYKNQIHRWLNQRQIPIGKSRVSKGAWIYILRDMMGKL
ncbi:unnamed protein product [Vicia faba]|uniref:Uncharacterized protein n=1 Tax=Vicia faba TaxID=3906 RepID=A0AAV1A1H7_VICFA|nr:unnamed protein product [Vicia faba]